MLKEAKRAKIPVILTDRAVDSKDTSLYKTFLGSDFVKEGKLAGEWVVKEYKGTTKDVNIVELQGTTGSAPAIDRKQGFRAVIKANPNLKIIASQTGDFTRAKGKEVMEAFLKAQPEDRPAVRAQRRHGSGRDRGDRGGRPQARQGHQDRHDRRRQRRHDGARRRARSTSSPSAARCSARS